MGPVGAGGAATRSLLFCMSRECLVWQFSRISSAWGTKSPRAFTFDVRFYPKTQLSWLARLDHSHCNSEPTGYFWSLVVCFAPAPNLNPNPRNSVWCGC